MAKIIKIGECSCGCRERMIICTSDNRILYPQSGLGYVEYDPHTDYQLRIWDMFYMDTEEFDGETPVEYAVCRAYQAARLSDEPVPTDVFDHLIETLHVPFMS